MSQPRTAAAGTFGAPTAVSVESLVATVIESGAVSEVRQAQLVTDGLQHTVLILDQALVARFPRDDEAVESLGREVALLSRLAGRVTARLPIPVHVDGSFTLHRMLHGTTTSRESLGALPQRARDRLVDDVGQFMTELAGADVAGLDASPATTSVARLRSLRERADEHVVPLLWSHQRKWLDDLFAALATVSFAHAPSLIHGDLASYHLLHDPASGRLTGVLDFGVAGLGDPAVDLACLLSVWDERFAGDLTRTWPAAAELVDRARLVALALPLEWAVAALEEDRADMAVAHLGHMALDIAPIGSSFGPDARTGR